MERNRAKNREDLNYSEDSERSRPRRRSSSKQQSPSESDYDYPSLPDEPNRMASFNILANCAAKELKLLSTHNADLLEKENVESVEATYSDLEDELNVEFPMVYVGGKKVFKCTFHGCKKVFPSLSRMRRHYIIHTGVKPFKCLNSECPKSFSRRDNMIQHYKGHCLFSKKSQSSDSNE
ncbi:hypothetical protein NEHOM01_0713 [Nematocida homosporus]|uniref:uncharacterized protein n=1 Tax=Nematocida homosporus TaxID=1912981 RepID=UPI0022209644|nr:uncharacterized protein NEHOM01_0713 [Nematocida homosporus]KAI5185255.1 hypothetical protein NEHOM01_0713 [Nematocida homosporus]